jgi:hypothetical protein
MAIQLYPINGELCLPVIEAVPVLPVVEVKNIPLQALPACQPNPTKKRGRPPKRR